MFSMFVSKTPYLRVFLLRLRSLKCIVPYVSSTNLSLLSIPTMQEDHPLKHSYIDTDHKF